MAEGTSERAVPDAILSTPAFGSSPPNVTPGIFAEAKKAALNEEAMTNRRRLSIAYGLASALTTAFSISDVAFETLRPETTELTTSLCLRLGMVIPLLSISYRLRGEAVLSVTEIDFWASFMTPFLSVGVALLSLCVGGLESPYPGSVNLIACAYAFAPRRWTKLALSGVASVLLFPATILAAAFVWPIARAELDEPWFALDLAVETGIFAATVIVLIAAAHWLWALRREVFEARSIGRYRVERRLGRGGMGEVWAAFDTTLKRKVALKILRIDTPDQQALARFEREVRATIELTHPNTVRVLDIGVSDDGLSYYAMELLEGEPLSSLLAREGRLSPERAVHIALQTARALTEAHVRGIVHRDIKPENLFITRMGGEPDFVKVLDFGIARLARQDGARLTQIGMVAGTPQFLAPEVLEGAEATSAADVYAIGVVLYEMLTGRPPYGNVEGAALVLAQVSALPERPSRHVDLSDSLEGIVMKALATSPRQRYPSARELAEALVALGMRESWRTSIELGHRSDLLALTPEAPTTGMPTAIAKPSPRN